MSKSKQTKQKQTINLEDLDENTLQLLQLLQQEKDRTSVGYKERVETLNFFKIFSREWRIKESKATIIILHGYGEYSGRYTKAGEFFSKMGYNVFMPDLPGHGRSSGLPNRGYTYIDSLQTYIDTLNQYIEYVKYDMNERGVGSTPLFFFGHSMGGLLTSMLARQRGDIRAFVASAPAYIVKASILYTLWYLWLIILLILPNFVMETGGSSMEMMNNPEVAMDYDKDPYTYQGKVCAKTTIEMARQGWIERDLDVTVPFYLMHGDADTLIDVEGSRRKQKHLKNPLSKYVEYPGANHVLLEEKNQNKILIEIEKWLDGIIKQE